MGLLFEDSGGTRYEQESFGDKWKRVGTVGTAAIPSLTEEQRRARYKRYIGEKFTLAQERISRYAVSHELRAADPRGPPLHGLPATQGPFQQGSIRPDAVFQSAFSRVR